jgi:hypothetical protein
MPRLEAQHRLGAVLQKCGFKFSGECDGPSIPGQEPVEDFIFVLIATAEAD